MKLRRKVFVEIARAAYGTENLNDAIEAIPYRITPTEKPRYRESVYRERAIAAERVRLAMGMSLNPQDRPAHITNGLSASNISEKYYEPPLMQVIPSACEKCRDNVYEVVSCRRCVARYCVSVCPTGAVSVEEESGKAKIDGQKCVKCGKCRAACPYSSIVRLVRPCAEACGVNAIASDGLGRAVIDIARCVACGQCMVHCPFGAIADKSQIFQLIRALGEGDEIVAEIAPAAAGQFGENATLGQLAAALAELGFCGVYEVARGADESAVAEAREYAEKVATGAQPYLLTACCPSWSMLAKRRSAGQYVGLSAALTPMAATARAIKRERPHARVVFIGPCAAKKLEAMRESVRGDVDFVITFEELAAIFEAKNVRVEACGELPLANEATAAGRGYGAAGGVAGAVEACVRALYPAVEVCIRRAEGLADCGKALALAKTGKSDGCLIEGMACPGGCAGGAGVNLPVERGIAAVKNFAAHSEKKLPKAQ